jgi:hypothetical protein
MYFNPIENVFFILISGNSKDCLVMLDKPSLLYEKNGLLSISVKNFSMRIYFGVS